MTNIGYFSLALFWMSLLLCHVATALPAPDEEQYFDKQLNRELINRWLSSIHNAQILNNNPCRFYGGDGTWTAPLPKRNSELINSLLSLPKSMNDAGK
ncbi:peptide deformylase, mitochondrial precursor [Musca domestica]|uniref:Peptide deformylase, mitochondrial precursor n=1 Tax=Musca domestica TaxID=7370 RepID=Q76JT9_MUSDO|nr:peptide deformylase, mitochondrial precursor [Musca domestica]BAD13522.1 pigment-dispersing factor [Musca domestica]